MTSIGFMPLRFFLTTPARLVAQRMFVRAKVLLPMLGLSD